ncbi:hypothetical protein LPU83_pLPU83d_0321 (plasmid) [Rhizobium favelukesii]|uniref:Uncharacterized protein n=1 Tax=Rhizobium favelukesii TaxID=348824 RepID=W6RKM1_9HYPH|nr:hypothetical protein LPU83_pLPU83d_0321 [Rhizobium favelukesii]
MVTLGNTYVRKWNPEEDSERHAAVQALDSATG